MSKRERGGERERADKQERESTRARAERESARDSKRERARSIYRNQHHNARWGLSRALWDGVWHAFAEEALCKNMKMRREEERQIAWAERQTVGNKLQSQS